MPSGKPNTCKRAAAATLHQPHHTTTAASDPDNGPSRWICLLGCVSMQCRYALTSPLTAYPGPIHWSHISDDIFHDHLHFAPQPSTQAAPPTVCWPTDCGHRHSTDPFTDYIMVRPRPRSVWKLPFRLSANPFSFAIPSLSRQRSSPLPWASDRLPAFETLHSEGANLRLRLHPSDT